MRKEKLTLLAFISILSLVTVAHLLRKYEGQPASISKERLIHILDQYRTAGNLASVSGGYTTSLDLYLIGGILVLNSKYHKKLAGYQINGPVREDHINIYFVKNDPQNILQFFEPTCTYRGFMNIIICDLAFIDEMQSVPPVMSEILRNQIEGINPEDTELNTLADKVYRAQIEDILLWILGHELGHLAHDHGESHFISDAKPYFDSIEEERADEFAIEVGEADSAYENEKNTPIKGLFAFQLYFSLVSVIDSLGIQIITEQGYSPSLINFVNQSSAKILLKRQSKAHMLFLRALNMQITLINRYQYESSGYYDKLKSHIDLAG